MRAIITLLSALLSFNAMAQEIAGKVIDEMREPGVGVTVKVYTSGVLKGSTVTDYDGNYVIKPLEPGHYDVLVCSAGYDSVCIKNVLVSPYQRTSLNFGLTKITGQPKTITKEYRKPLIDRDDPHSLIHNDEIRQIPGCGPTDLVWSQVGVYQSKRGADVNIGGGRGNICIIGRVQLPDTMGVDRCDYPISEIEIVNPGTFVFHRNQLSRLVYRDLNDLLRSVPENTQYGFENKPHHNNNSGYSYIVDGMHLLNRY